MSLFLADRKADFFLLFSLKHNCVYAEMCLRFPISTVWEWGKQKGKAERKALGQDLRVVEDGGAKLQV